LSETALEQHKRDLFMAHEVAQMIPFFGEDYYWQMRAANAWVNEQLPNADIPYYTEPKEQIGHGWAMLKRGIEALLGGRLGDTLEGWEYRRKLRRFAQDMRTPHSSAELDEQQVKGHFNDHGHPVLQKYSVMLTRCGLEEAPLSTPGD